MRLRWFSAGGAFPLPLAGEGWGHLIGMNVGPRASAPIRRASSSASSLGSEPVSRPSTAKRER
jgi:hypothetical protein